ncbi:MAG: hypothetical protein WBA74_10340 [Cyclobacteriaceae bacterium]
MEVLKLIDSIEIVSNRDEILLDPFKDVRNQIGEVIFNKNYTKKIKDTCKKLYDVIEGKR